MPPPSGGVPRTPDRRSSSSALFGAFRALTGGRIGSPTPPPSTSSAADTPNRTPSLNTQSRPGSLASPLATTKEISTKHEPHHTMPGAQETVIGGPPELSELVGQLKSSVPHSERVAATRKICDILGSYPVQNVLAIWSPASDLLAADQPEDAAESAYLLLNCCAALPELTPVERNVFLSAVLQREADKQFAKRLLVVSTLTNGGRNVDALESSIVTFVLSSLESCFIESKSARRSHEEKGKQSADTNLTKLFQYTVSICQFNSRVFSADHLELLLIKVMTICQDTSLASDIENSINLIDTVITYGHMPLQSLAPCLETLCSIHRQLPKFQEQTWNTLTNLFKSHVGHAATNSLLHTLLNGPQRLSREFSIYKGVLKTLQLLLIEDGHLGLPKIPISLVLPALRKSLDKEHDSHERAVLELIAALLNEEKMRALLLEEADWSNLVYIIRTCAEREEEREGATPQGTPATSTPTQEANNNPYIDLTATSTRRIDLERRNSDSNLAKVLRMLDSLSAKMDPVQRVQTVDLLMRLVHRINDSSVENLLNFYMDERYLDPSHADWLEVCQSVVAGVLNDPSRPRSLRLLTIKVLRDTYSTIEKLCATEIVLQCASLLLNSIQAEDDMEVLHALVDFAVDIADRTSDADFPNMIALLKKRLLSKQLKTTDITQSAKKTLLLYDTLRQLAGCDEYESDARLSALKLLFRLRAESNHALIVSLLSEGESMAAVLCRTAETAVAIDKPDDAASDSGRVEDPTSWRDQRKVSSNSPHSSMTRHVSRSTHPPGRISKPVPPLWLYPGPKGLPEEPSTESSRFVFAHKDAEEYPLPDDILDLQVTLWLELIISLLQSTSDWEIYSYVVVHLGSQLSNQALVRSCVPQLKMLRSVLCEQLRGSTFKEPPAYTSLKKADVAVCLFHVLTMIISYHDHFEKSEEDDLVKTFLHGIGHWDRTSKWCIHALSVCCQEMPLSVSKTMENIIQKMSQIITKPSIAIHILEFLTSLARMPELRKNFREDEFKTVFGVSFRYLQHVRDQRERVSTQTAPKALRHSGTSREFAGSPDQSKLRRKRSPGDDLPDYVYALGYYVITFWFMCLKIDDRPKFIPWITKNLVYVDSSGKQVIEEQGHVIIDMMNMVAYSDRDETKPDLNFAKPGDGEIWKKTWIVGHSLLTIETAARTGVSLITTRRPCGTRYSTIRPLLTSPPRHQIPITVGLASDTFYTSNYVGILPDHIFQMFYSPLNLSTDPPVALTDDDHSRRAIASFDRNATVDGYRVGVIYMGEGQSNEREILMNSNGSAPYSSFLADLGTLVKLKGADFNTGGLDTRNDTDGEHTFCWRDRCIELVFHITTMMPSDANDDMTYPNKKRHIGNDFVNIIFNDSGMPYKWGTFPSQFDYVQVITRPDFPDISPAVEPKIICGKHLAAYCRLIAINASVFSQAWFEIQTKSESISSWRNRLRDIKRLRERYSISDSTSSPSSPVHHQQEVRLSSPPSRTESAMGFKRTSVATYIGEGTNRSSVAGSSTDVAL
ncbi:hypothetical protein EJ04DRAFT_492681 [Polyplosphaeria fusca]|uniref:Rap-GAP domain-containing protein n=1 Tax=Polyplosphaeria fusca TaxID=682080 RepID=A0A9P4R143_9PLEO|nr:hypothetical protein EJ04DRAFT_492681 [Polyplosphaeria fusca]